MPQNSFTFTNFGTPNNLFFLPGPVEELNDDIKAILNSNHLENAHYGLSVYSITKDTTLININENKNFIPASIQKIITSSAALSYLGEKFQFVTTLSYSGFIDDEGNLNGDLIIHSNGDPSINYNMSNPDSLFNEWVIKLDSLGIYNINGNIIADFSDFDNTYYGKGWQIDDLGFDYSPGITPLILNDNAINIQFYAVDSNSIKSEIILQPDYKNLKFINNVKVNKNISYSSIDFKFTNNDKLVIFSGDLAYNSPTNFNLLQISVPNPENFLIDYLEEFLIQNSVSINGGYKISNEKLNNENFVLIAEHKSQYLIDILEIVNSQSSNLISEILVKTLGKEKSGIGSFEVGLRHIKEYIEEFNIDTKNLYLADGSGLSRMNLISPKIITKLLDKIYDFPDFKKFRNTFASPGKGTLRNRLKNSYAKNRLWAKTGSMKGVSNIAGYILTKDNELLCFTLLINNFNTNPAFIRNIEDLICIRLASFSREIILDPPTNPNNFNKLPKK